MLDIKSKLVLKILVKECPNGSYNIVDGKDIISSMPMKYRIDLDALDNILIYLERQELISIKYDDDGIYCLCILPYGNEVLENEGKKEKADKKISLISISAACFASSLLAGLICILISYLIGIL